ncbi:acyl-coenzyme A diphosphatase FITM2-like [Asterias amurensis]|uniref:acyl-coenzyme A diphosphatase FITM2-like n=1 Tax=Asterias amurensis TaxID=7602 RepID=UPI003AB81450
MPLPVDSEPHIRQKMSSNSSQQTVGVDTPVADTEGTICDELFELLYNITLAITHVTTLHIVQFFCVSVTIGSFMYEFFPIRESYFSNKHNFLNQYFVKLAWGWTMALHTPLIITTGLLQTPVNFLQTAMGLSRVLLVGTTVWFGWVEIVFQWVMQLTGSCIGDKNLTDVRSCFKAGHHWDGFDISGHCFLLIYSALLIHEELRIVHQNSTQIKPSLDAVAEKQTSKENKKDKLIFLQKFFTILLILLECLWMLMVSITAVYFHALSHKLIGAGIAILSWHVTYNIWYKMSLSPGSS